MDEVAKMYDEQCGAEHRHAGMTHSCVLRGGHHPQVSHVCWCSEAWPIGARVELSEGEQR